MRVLCLISIFCLGLFLSAFSLHAQEGFTGPNLPSDASPIDVSRGGQITPMTVRQVSAFSHDTAVLLMGNIVNSSRKDIFTFRDGTGDIQIKVGSKDWKGLSISPNDIVIISGHVKLNKAGQMEIDVKTVMKG